MEAARRAISSPLLEDASIDGARGVIINVTGGPDLSLIEVSEASSIIHEAAHEDANIIFGAVVDPQLEGQVKITVIATGFDRAGARRRRPGRRRADAGRPAALHGLVCAEQRRRRCGGAAITLARRHGVGASRAAAAGPAAGDAARTTAADAADGEAARRRSKCRRSCVAEQADDAGRRPQAALRCDGSAQA